MTSTHKGWPSAPDAETTTPKVGATMAVSAPSLLRKTRTMNKRTWEHQDPWSDAALVDPGITFDRTNDEYNQGCRDALIDSDPGKLNGSPDGSTPR